MESESARDDVLTLRDYLSVVRRRKWTIVLVLFAVPIAAVGFSLRQEPLYSASADVFINRDNPVLVVTG
ncbi:MAG: Wzz/FepE/Etk N-terminal domain-containing protein, partial [Gaiellaceae bacterium]